MNKSLRRIFNVVIILFVLLGISSTILMVFAADSLNSDTRNRRTLYSQYAIPRSSILAADGTVLASSTAVNDTFKYLRSYSNGPVYAPVTGYYSVTIAADRGIEASRNALLSGTSSSLWLSRLKTLFTGSENSGAIIETSIDTALQTKAYELMQNYKGAVVAIEPSTGRILAMVSTPSYDPNVLASHDTSSVASNYTSLIQDTDNNSLLNRATSELYSPGSTFKLVVAAAALESGNYDTDTEIPAGSSYTLPNTSTNLTNTTTAAAGTNGTITLSDALAYSSNTAFAQLGVTLGQSTIESQAEKLGFGTTINIDGNSSMGRPMKAVASSFPSTTSVDKLALASIGQDDTVETPLLNAMIAATIANGGKMMKPTLVDRVRASDLSVISTRSNTTLSQAFSSDTASKLTSMMESVITKEYPSLQLTNSTVAAKTGTAQTGTSNQTNNAWITGFAPSNDPKIAIAVVISGSTEHGGDVAGPIMKELMQEYLDETD